MAVGSNTEISFYGDEKDLDEIYKMADDGSEGEFYLRVFGKTREEYNSLTDDQQNKFLKRVGVNSMCQAYCSAVRDEGKVTISLYSTYDTPKGVWKKMAKNFPNVKAIGHVIREDDPDCTKGYIVITSSDFTYDTPEICKRSK